MTASILHSLSRLACVAAATALVACGGGGGSDEPADRAFVAEGLWDTTIEADGVEGGVLVLEDGTVWAYAADIETGAIGSMYQGRLDANGNALSSANLRIFGVIGGSVTDATGVAGTLSGSTFELQASYYGSTHTIAGTRTPDDAAYAYDAPAQLSDIAGVWTGAFTNNDQGAVTVQANGNFSSTTTSGCSFTGVATPRASGKNVFDVTLTFGPAPCLLPGESGSGVALATRPTPTDPAVLLVMATNSSRDAAALYLALRAQPN